MAFLFERFTLKASETEEVEEQEVQEDAAADEPSDDDDGDEEEEEVEDPQATLKEEVSSSCGKYQKELDVCTERVSSRSNTTETCEQELYDFIHCRDCKVAQSLFKQLK